MKNPLLFHIASLGDEEPQTQVTDITLRDLFAAFAIAGVTYNDHVTERRYIAIEAYEMADAMLAQREVGS